MKLTMQHVELAKGVLKHYGEEAQALKTIEELAELQRAIARQDLENIEEEIADVLIMVLQLLFFEGIRINKVFELVTYKMDRQLKRIEREKVNR